MTASNRSRTVHLTYNHDAGSWWAESEQLPGLFAGGDQLDEAKELARQVVADEFGDDVTVAEWMPMPGALEKCLVGKPGEKDSESRGEKCGSSNLPFWPEDESQDLEPDLTTP